MQQKNFLLFLSLTFLAIFGYIELRNRLWPPQPVQPAANEMDKDAAPIVGRAAAPGDGARTALGVAGAWAARPVSPAVAVKAPEVVPPTDASKLIRLGGSAVDGPSRFHLDVDLDPRGAAVRRVVLNKFPAADKEGRPVWKDKVKRIPEPVELIPDAANREFPSFVLYHYDVRDSSADRPLDTLGRAAWTLVNKDNPIGEDTTADGRNRQRVSFQTEVQGVALTKTYTLVEGDYHIGLEIKMSRKTASGNDRPFRYQLTGGHGQPIEGEWYTPTFRNAMIARVDGGSVYRDLQDLRQIALWQGGNEVLREKNRPICYAASAVQYFASVIAVDDKQDNNKDFLLRARPTLEKSVTKGRIKSIASDSSSFVLVLGDHTEQTFYVPSDAELQRALAEFGTSKPVGVTHRTDGVLADGKLRSVVVAIGSAAETQPLFIDDINVRVMSEPVELKPGVEVVHKFVLYNGPVKPMLLGQLTGDAAVPPEVVARYLNDLHLNTLTDYQSPGPVGSFASTIYWTDLVVKCTNLMHSVLEMLHRFIPNYGICIILLTVMVRGIMFPISRKQAIMSIKMQELAPELKKLQAKLKDDRQAMGAAQMELYRKHGVNPFGSCWFLLLQMPVFMGLYFCLQESIHFRLAEFWPTWIINLAAPDMMIDWGQRIPFLSRPEDYGGMLYLGPYFNLLPVIAVALMIAQQKMMTPPPTDEQQEMQQKIMKYMMIFFGLMFYKVAAGLCVYFIASSLWGFTERKLLPKKKPVGVETSAESLFQRMLKRGDEATEAANSSSTAVTGESTRDSLSPIGGDGARNGGRRKKGKRGREQVSLRAGSIAAPTKDAAPSGLRGWWQVRKERLAAWWEELLRQAEKKR